jgi:hypothetical protein
LIVGGFSRKPAVIDGRIEPRDMLDLTVAFDHDVVDGAGGAARGIARRLRRHDYHLVSDPEGFIVDDSYGPLRTGEVERAKQWGAQLVSQTVRSLG